MHERLVAQIGLLAFAAGLIIASTAFAGTAVTLRAEPSAKGDQVTLGDLFEGLPAAAAKTPVAKAMGGASNTILDAPKVQAAARAAGFDWDNPTGMRRVVVATAETAQVKATTGPRKQALAYGRNIAAGEIVAANDLVWSDEAVAPSDAPADADAVIGQAARRPLRQGAAVGGHDVAPAKVVKRDEIIAVTFEVDGIRLVLQGKSLTEAAVGELIQVQNPQSKKILQAMVTGPGEAVVGPRADALRAQNSGAQPYRTALR